jgi:hypothetical protein
MSTDKPKMRWADMTDDDPYDLDVPVVISKHGVKVAYVPPHQRPDKTKKPLDSKKK